MKILKILHLDIETAPNTAYVWGLWNENIPLSRILDSGYVLCFAAKWHGTDKVMFHKCDNKEKMLDAAWDLLSEADAVVHYNGKRFDIPTLNKEFIENAYMPPDPYHQIDLLQAARQQFRFPSNKLDYVAQALGVGQKHNHRGFELWIECMQGKKSAWKEMETYNKQDVLLLERVYNKMLPWIKNHPNAALYVEDANPVCPKCGSTHVHKKGVEHTKTLTYQRYRCVDCSSPLRGRTNIMTAEKRKNILVPSKL